MHFKKSELQIGKESTGFSSDFNPTPPLKNHLLLQINHLLHQTQPPNSHSLAGPNDLPPSLLSTPHKRPLMAHSPTLNSLSSSHSHLDSLPSSSHPTSPVPRPQRPVATALKSASRILRRLRSHHPRSLLLLLSFPSLYIFLSTPARFFLLDLLSAVVFSALLLVSINLAIPRLPSIRLLLSRSFPLKLSSRRPPPPVLWSIGSNPKSEKRPNSGTWVQAYSNGDVYEGEFHRGKCSGSGVYYYYMSGRYEGDWVDEKYDGYGVETWARGSRYRGQYRKGLRHGYGIYRFYTGDVYAGEWSNGQSHGSGVHTCEDGSRYVGEFKWGVKHGLGHYHFR